MFINLSNHDSKNWATAQREAAMRWGEIEDVKFPPVPAGADEAYIKDTADAIAADIISKAPEAVMVQGEFTLCFAIVERLKAAGIAAVAACSERVVKESFVDGEYRKVAGFEFVRFREY